MTKQLYILLLLLLVFGTANSQESKIIYLDNPSFEGQARAGNAPEGWADCGDPQESPPDIQPYGGFSVTRPAKEGKTYVGLVTRDNKTWEAIAQRLTEPLRKGKCYKFNIHACKSPAYISPTRKNQSVPVNFSKGVVIRVWGGNNYCDRAQLLASTEKSINHFDWRMYKFELKPEEDFTFICIEAYYKTPTLAWYNGNLLIDNASEIFSCDIEEDPLATNDKPDTTEDETKPKENEKDTNETTNAPKDPLVSKGPPTTSAENLKLTDRGNFEPEKIKIDDLEVGHLFRLEKLYFPADSFKITRNSEKVLYSLFRFLRDNPRLYIEIGGHTNSLPPADYCDKLSTKRAKNVANYLIEQGIDKSRIAYKGYGKRRPISNNTTALGRTKNQRVELIITFINDR